MADFSDMRSDRVELDKFVVPDVFNKGVVGDDAVAVFGQQVEDIALIFRQSDDLTVSHQLFGGEVKRVFGSDGHIFVDSRYKEFLNPKQQLHQIERFFQIIAASEPIGVGDAFDIGVGGHKDHRFVRIVSGDPFDHFEPVGAGDVDIENIDVGVETALIEHVVSVSERFDVVGVKGEESGDVVAQSKLVFKQGDLHGPFSPGKYR